MNIPVKGTVYELMQDVTDKGYLFPAGSRFKIWTIRLTTRYDYVTINFPALINKHSPLDKTLYGRRINFTTKEFNALQVKEVDGK